jgi:hypothetical protein
MHHFGAGLVSTPSDFGRRSDPPSHPELLDWLASEFIRSGWKVKELQRLIVKSATYQQMAAGQNPAADPENRLLSRMNRLREDYETQRDALLAVSRRLDFTPGGPPVGREQPRRTLYGYIDRLDLPPVMATFDFPTPSVSCPKRAETTVPPQALYMMNNDFVAECAGGLIKRSDVAERSYPKSRVERLYAILFARSPKESELKKAEEFLGPEPNENQWQQYAQALLISNEFVFVD